MALLPPIVVLSAWLFLSLDDIDAVLGGDFEPLRSDPMVLAATAGALWGLAAIHAKRLHDRDRTAWWAMALLVLAASGAVLAWNPPTALRLIAQLAALITLPIAVWLVVEGGAFKGTAGPNRFGPVPADAPLRFKPVKGSDIAVAGIRGLLWSPLGILIVLPLQVLELLWLPFRYREVLFGFHGRIGRRSFWFGLLGAPVLALVVDMLVIGLIALLSGKDSDALRASPAMMPVHLLCTGLALWAVGAIGAKRLHDRNRTGWWAAALVGVPLLTLAAGYLPGEDEAMATVVNLLLLILLALSLWLIVELGFLRGVQGATRFDPDPPGARLADATAQQVPR